MSRQKKAKKTTCVTREAKESLGTILAEKILGFAPRISCQYNPLKGRRKRLYLIFKS
jgi:hypothetical protein